MMKLTHAVLAGSLILLAGCVSSQDRAAVNVGYYNVKGTSFAELDREIALHGPTVDGVGKAIASTRVRMIPDVRYANAVGLCTVAKARISVIADVTLPRLSDRNRVDSNLRKAFSNIEEYARLHEAVHVDIAEQHASMAEEKITALPAKATCDMLQKDVLATFSSVMTAHEAAQQAFDAREQQRFASNRRPAKSTVLYR